MLRNATRNLLMTQIRPLKIWQDTWETKQLTLPEERKNLCEQGRALRKKVINFKRPFKSTIQEYKKVDCMLKKEAKKSKKKATRWENKDAERSFKKKQLP